MISPGRGRVVDTTAPFVGIWGADTKDERRLLRMMGTSKRAPYAFTVCILDDDEKIFEFRTMSDSCAVMAGVAEAVANGRHVRCHVIAADAMARDRLPFRRPRPLGLVEAQPRTAKAPDTTKALAHPTPMA